MLEWLWLGLVWHGLTLALVAGAGGFHAVTALVAGAGGLHVASLQGLWGYGMLGIAASSIPSVHRFNERSDRASVA